jgi:hypothetical protein
MKRITVPMMCLLIFFSLGMLSYAQTVMTDVWKDKEYRGPVKKITVLCIAQDRARRIALEDLFITQLKARGTDAMPAYVVIPPDKLVDSETALTNPRPRLDGILTVRIVSKLTIQTQILNPERRIKRSLPAGPIIIIMSSMRRQERRMSRRIWKRICLMQQTRSGSGPRDRSPRSMCSIKKLLRILSRS